MARDEHAHFCRDSKIMIVRFVCKVSYSLGQQYGSPIYLVLFLSIQSEFGGFLSVE